MGAIVQFIWTLLGPTIVNLAITTGLPAALEWLMKKGLPQWLANGLIAIAKSALDQISNIHGQEDLHPQQKSNLVKLVKIDAKKKACDHAMAGCPSDTKQP